MATTTGTPATFPAQMTELEALQEILRELRQIRMMLEMLAS